MVEKTFCDKCGTQIAKPKYSVSLYNSQSEDNEIEGDLCNRCTILVLHVLKAELSEVNN